MIERCQSCGRPFDDGSNWLATCACCDASVHDDCSNVCDLCFEHVCDKCISRHPSADEGVCRTCAGTESWERAGYLVP
jgi:hypothetical protein